MDCVSTKFNIRLFNVHSLMMKAMFFWSKELHVKLGFIQPGKPTHNAFLESFNGKFRAAVLFKVIFAYSHIWISEYH